MFINSKRKVSGKIKVILKKEKKNHKRKVSMSQKMKAATATAMVRSASSSPTKHNKKQGFLDNLLVLEKQILILLIYCHHCCKKNDFSPYFGAREITKKKSLYSSLFLKLVTL